MTPAPPQSNEDELLDVLRESVDQLMTEHVDDDANFEKLLQFLRLRKADYYYRGIQYIAPDLSPTGVVDYTPIGSPVVGSEERRGLLDYNIDQIRTYGRKFIATLGQRPFYNQKAVPDNPKSEVDRTAAREAEKAYFTLRAQWDVKIKNLELPYHAWKSGTIYPYTRYVADPNKYGWTEEPILSMGKIVVEPGGYKCFQCGNKGPELASIEMPDENGEPQLQTACSFCGRPLDESSYEPPVEADVPQDTGETRKYPNGRVELHFRTGFFVTVPFYSPDIQSVPFLEDRCEEHVGRLVSLYPKLRDKLKNGELNVGPDSGTMQQSGLIARSSAESQVGIPRQQNKSRITYTRTWLRPLMYELVSDQQMRDQLKLNFPEGLRVVRVGKEIVKIAHEKLDDYFCAVYPEVGEYIFRDGISWGIFAHQDAINDTFNQLAEIVERCNTITLAHADIIDVDALRDRQNTVAEWITVPPKSDLAGGVKTLPSPTFPKEATQLLGITKENIESHTGVLPPIFGAGGPTQQTAEQNRNELNQALMQLGTTGEFMIAGWTQIFTNGIWELARNAPRNPISKDGEEIDLEALKAGKWHLEGEIGIPRSFAERKDELKTLVTQNPMLASALRIDAPINAGAVRDYLDLPDMEDPADDERQFVNECIDELLQGQPVRPAQVDPNAPPPPPMPSATRLLDLVDAGVLDPSSTAELIREWVVGQAGRKLYGTPGFENVMAVMRQLKQMLMPPPQMGPDGQPQPPPPGAGTPPGPNAPKPPANSGGPEPKPQGSLTPPPGKPTGAMAVPTPQR